MCGWWNANIITIIIQASFRQIYIRQLQILTNHHYVLLIFVAIWYMSMWNNFEF